MARTLVTARDPKKMTKDGTLIDLTVKFAEFPAEMRFTASKLDTEPHGRDIYDRALAGEFGTVAEADDNAPSTYPRPRPLMP